MKLDLKRLFARSMTGGVELAGPPAPPSQRFAKQKTMFVTLAGLLALIGAIVGAYYFAMRPVTLRIAVGPANSDDVKVVQALTQAFAQAHGYVRLRPVQTDGAAASAARAAATAFMTEIEDSVDRTRIHFLGFLTSERYRAVLQISAVHIYFTYPFVLSWSLIEAMAAGVTASAYTRVMAVHPTIAELLPTTFGDTHAALLV